MNDEQRLVYSGHHSSFIVPVQRFKSEPAMKSDKDRREAKRISYICEVECDGSGVSRLATRINDLSMTGAFIDTVTNFSPGTILKLRFRVKNIRIETTAEVRYCMPRMGVGVRFLDLKPEHAAALESLIEGKPLVLPPPTLSYGKERREAKRISYVCEVECEGAGLNRLVTRINDLSMTGTFIDSTTCYSPGTVLRLRFRIKGILIEASAQVRYTTPQKGMGVRFLDLKPDHVAALESLIEGKPLVMPPPTRESPGRGSQPESGMSKTPDMLSGNFAVVSMFDVIQIIENNRLGGALVVTSPAANGEIQFNDGQIVGAHSGLKTGIDALKRFLDVTEGSFELKRSPNCYPVTIDAPSNMSLMLDLLRVRDEEAALR